MKARVGLIGDFNPEVTAHRAIPVALRLASEALEATLEPIWVGTTTLKSRVEEQLSDFQGLWCVPASPYANTQGAMEAIRFARETSRPFLGTCGGFQHALLEYARNGLGLQNAAHAENQPDAEMLFIAPLSCSLVEESQWIEFEAESRVRSIYGAASALEQYHCRYGLNPQYDSLLQGSGLRITGHDVRREARVVELDRHPFFLATLYQPERSALRGESHPLIEAFAFAVLKFAEGCG